MLHKSAQYIFPILTPDGQKDLIAQQMAMTGGEQWTWKYGPSSPSATDFVLVPTDDESSYRVVFRLSGSGVNDARSAYTVQTIRENKNSSVIGDIRELSTDSSDAERIVPDVLCDRSVVAGFACSDSWQHGYADGKRSPERGRSRLQDALCYYFGMAIWSSDS